MADYHKKVEIRWADLDPNFHVLHSRYLDFGAYVRMAFMNEHGLTPAVMRENNIGPIIFREECIYKKEINFADELLVSVKLVRTRVDASRWTMVHELWKNTDTLAALITADGAWLNTMTRKLAVPPEICKTVFDLMPKTDNFNQ